ncbi:MAG: hypothetical protein JXB23_04085 [Candidatus Aminicenantes bacterium]|nr:hypothetical protein [Candidatus Aminicenantes bacterium]
MTKAAELFFNDNDSDPVKPSWGNEDTHTFLAVAYLRKNDPDKTREHLQKALEINPDYALAKTAF